LICEEREESFHNILGSECEERRGLFDLFEFLPIEGEGKVFFSVQFDIVLVNSFLKAFVEIKHL
jgi:hypothetical protein